MSIFDQTTDQNTENQAPLGGATSSFVERLVASKGEQWNDPEVIAKGKVEADDHIMLLEQQLKEMREDLGKQDYSRQLLETLQQSKAQETPPAAVVQEGTQPAVTPVEVETIESLVAQALQKRETTATAESNLALANASMVETFGTEAAATVQAKANELGMSLDSLRDLAAQSPAAFASLIGSAPVSQAGSAPRTSVNSAAAFQSNGDRDYAYYAALRKSDKERYYSPQVQREMLADRQKLGRERFGT
jgi:hypothetical protein